MGFWGNLANEAGKKTGKAIGNAVFGKHAADQVIDVNGVLVMVLVDNKMQ